MENKLLQLKEAELCATEIVIKYLLQPLPLQDARLSRIAQVR